MSYQPTLQCQQPPPHLLTPSLPPCLTHTHSETVCPHSAGSQPKRTAALLQRGGALFTPPTPMETFPPLPPSPPLLKERVIGLFGTALPLCSLPGRLQEAGSAVIQAPASRGRRGLRSNRGAVGLQEKQESLGMVTVIPLVETSCLYPTPVAYWLAVINRHEA